jgi:hypothetical protein
MSSRGTPNAQNTQLLNGVNVNDPAAQGFSMNYYTPETFENVEVSTGSQDISVGTGGILINMVTKSGTNRISGSGLYTYQGEKTQADNIDSTLKAFGIRPNANATDLIQNTNFQMGGPAIKNKLFYFGSVNYQQTHVAVVGFPLSSLSFVPTPLANTSDRHHRHSRRRRQNHVSAEWQQSLRGVSLEAALRQAESRREQSQHPGVELQRARHVRDHPAGVQPRDQQHDVPRQQDQLQQHALPPVSEDGHAAADR